MIEELELVSTKDLVEELCRRETIDCIVIVNDLIRNVLSIVALSDTLEPEEGRKLLRLAMAALRE